MSAENARDTVVRQMLDEHFSTITVGDNKVLMPDTHAHQIVDRLLIDFFMQAADAYCKGEYNGVKLDKRPETWRKQVQEFAISDHTKKLIAKFRDMCEAGPAAKKTAAAKKAKEETIAPAEEAKEPKKEVALCAGKKKDGAPCAFKAGASGFCGNHDPHKADKKE